VKPVQFSCDVIRIPINYIRGTVSWHPALALRFLPKRFGLDTARAFGSGENIDHVIDSAPIAIGDAMIQVLVDFLLARAAHNTHGKPDLHFAALLAPQAFGFLNSGSRLFGHPAMIEVQIRIANSEAA